MACTSKPVVNKELNKLKNHKNSVDSAINAGSLSLFIKLKNKPGLVPLIKGMDKKKMEAAYNIFKDKTGKMVYIAEMPYSPDDEYFIAYKNYFDEEGKLFAFERINNFFGSECAERAALEGLIKFYTNDFKMVDSVYTLTDSKNNKLEKVKCKFPYNFPYTIKPTLKTYLEERGITGM